MVKPVDERAPGAAGKGSKVPPAERPKDPTVPAAPDAKDAAEHGGPKGPDPTRYGDWERKGRCVDF